MGVSEEFNFSGNCRSTAEKNYVGSLMTALGKTVSPSKSPSAPVLASINFLELIIEFYKNCCTAQSFQEITVGVEHALQSFGFPYVLLLSLQPDKTLIFSSNQLVTVKQLELTKSLAAQEKRVIHYRQHVTINLPFLFLYAVVRGPHKAQHLAHLLRLAESANFIMENVVNHAQRHFLRQKLQQQTLAQLNSIITNINQIEASRAANSIQALGQLQWALNNHIAYIDISDNHEKRLIDAINNVFHAFENHQAGSRLIDDLLRSARMYLDTMAVDKQELAWAFIR